jgi:hypothetical protein
MRYFYNILKASKIVREYSKSNPLLPTKKERKVPIGDFRVPEHVESLRLCRGSAPTIVIILLSATKRTDIEFCIFFVD